MPTTTVHALRYPAATDPADVPADMQKLANDVDVALLPANTVAAAATRVIANLLLAADAQPAFRILGNGRHDWGAGGANPTDTNLYRKSPGNLASDGALWLASGGAGNGIVFNPTGAGGNAIQTIWGAETQPRWRSDTNGVLAWGPGGTTAPDTNLYRSAVDTLTTDDTFTVNGPLFVLAAATTQRFGADTNLYRSAAGALKTDGQLLAGSWFKANAGTINEVIVGHNGAAASRAIGFINDASSAYDVTLRRAAAGQLALAGVSYYAPVSDALLGAVKPGNGIEWGHSNPAGYRSVLGSDSGSGGSWIALHAEAGTTNNTFRTRGIQAAIIKAVSGGFAFGTVASANADNQTLVQTMSLSATGDLAVTGAVAANGRISGASLATSSYGTSFPASPVDGQEFTLVNGTTGAAWAWRFRYNASSSLASKWEYIGGTGYVAVTFTGGETLPFVNQWAPPPTLTDFVVPRTGDYMLEYGATFFSGAGGASTMQAAVCNASVSNTPITSPAIVYIPAANQPATVSAKYGATLTAGITIRLVYQQNLANGQITQRYIGVTPLRLS